KPPDCPHATEPARGRGPAPGAGRAVASSPAGLLRAARQTVLVQSLGAALTVRGVVVLVGDETATRLVLGSVAAFGVFIGTASASAWARWLTAGCWLAARRTVPWRFMRFVDDAHRRGVLRQLGGVYQFSHTKVQQRLAGDPGVPAADSAGEPGTGI